MKVLDALHILERYDEQTMTVWPLSSLRIALPEKDATFRKTIERLCAEGILSRISNGLYLFAKTRRDRNVVFGEVIAGLRRGEYCFESLDSAACTWGIVPQSPLGGITVMTTGRSGRVDTCYGPVEFVHTDAPIEEIVANTVLRDDFIPLATRDYTIHGLRRCGRTSVLDEAIATGWTEDG